MPVSCPQHILELEAMLYDALQQGRIWTVFDTNIQLTNRTSICHMTPRHFVPLGRPEIHMTFFFFFFWFF